MLVIKNTVALKKVLNIFWLRLILVKDSFSLWDDSASVTAGQMKFCKCVIRRNLFT